ncbi:hypothetical protein FB45DRAFT_216911 [Roridomyces roridus]|uniref:F-box domain-containing protein n=1 Tax=Roridomyces roridus TaxID=1738132 RepID=A0AAD7BDL0_9AGAR|nr:hypothetical protein FB45DRAFT_216911 [Roridomyces roridus]
MSFMLVPPEILCEILGLLQAETMLGCSTVCRTWHDAIRSSPILQYTIELWKDGLIPAYDNSSIVAQDRLNALQDRRRAWRDIAWSSQTVIDIGFHTCKAFEFVGGVFAVQEREPNFCTVSLTDLVADPNTSVSTRRHALPPGIDLQNHVDFAMDPTQDLLAILYRPGGTTGILSFRRVSDLRIHPLARDSAVRFEMEDIDDNFLEDVTMHISYDIVAISFVVPGRLVIFDWRRCLLLVDLAVSDHSGFQFISSRAFLLGSSEADGQVEIYTLNVEQPSHTHVATLRFPALDDDWFLSSIGAHSGPFCSHSIPGRRFATAHSRRIYCFEIQYNDGGFCARLFVHYRTFRRYIEQVQQQQTGPMEVPWEEWGPRDTRMLDGDLCDWHRFVHGERAIIPAGSPYSICILDFNRGSHHEAVDVYSTAEEMVSDSTVIESYDITGLTPFKDTVETWLPFRMTERELPGGDSEPFDQFMLEQDCVLGADEQVPDKMTVFIF